MCVRAPELILQAVPRKGCGGGLKWSEWHQFCPKPKTPEVSGWQRWGQADEWCRPQGRSKVRSAGARKSQGTAGRGLCFSLAVEQQERALSGHIPLPLDKAAQIPPLPEVPWV